MFVTVEHARTMLCPESGAKRLPCVAESCKAWRPVTLYAAFVRGRNKDGSEYVDFAWKLTKAENAHTVDCGFCGLAGMPNYSAEIMAPAGYDETSLVGLTTAGHTKTVRSLNKFERELMRKRGLLAEYDDGHRSPGGQYVFKKKRKKP